MAETSFDVRRSLGVLDGMAAVTPLWDGAERGNYVDLVARFEAVLARYGVALTDCPNAADLIDLPAPVDFDTPAAKARRERGRG
jgi:hypothetical protein